MSSHPEGKNGDGVEFADAAEVELGSNPPVVERPFLSSQLLSRMGSPSSNTRRKLGNTGHYLSVVSGPYTHWEGKPPDLYDPDQYDLIPEVPIVVEQRIDGTSNRPIDGVQFTLSRSSDVEILHETDAVTDIGQTEYTDIVVKIDTTDPSIREARM